MGLDEKIIARLDELIDFGEDKVIESARSKYSTIPPITYGTSVAPGNATRWQVNSMHILGKAFGQDSDHYRTFQSFAAHFPKTQAAVQALGVLIAAKDDYQREMLFDTRTLIEAEVFNDFLEQAEYLLKAHFYQPAAVVAGAVLEDGLRKLCARHNVTVSPTAKVETMNAELTRARVYNGLVQKQVTMFADLRNKAAHGLWDQFTEADVTTMLPQVRAFMTQHFS